MVPKMFVCTFAALLFLSGMDAARILALVPVASKSHHIWNSALMLGLAKKGHQITALSPDPPIEPNPNLKHMVLEGSYEKVKDLFDLESLVYDSPLDGVQVIWTLGIEICKHQLATKAAKDLLSMPPDSFDLIMVEVFCGECMFMYLHHFGGGTRIPVVGLTAYGIGPWTDILTGGWTLPSVFAYPILPYTSKMDIWERFYNTLVTGTHWSGMLFHYYPNQQKVAEHAYGKPLPPLQEIGSNISLILVNNHFVLNGPQAQLPGIIDVGAMQCSPPKALPKDIQSFLDSADQGAIYFSLGSNLQSEELPREKLQIIIETFAALGPKIRVLWKFDPKVPIEGLSSNVLLKKWLPQEDVLGHPKILAFVSHAGLLSTTEAIYHGKPIVAVPFFADQHTNAKRIVAMKVAEHVDFISITKESFLRKILNVINDSSYNNSMQKISRLLRDQPQTPLERAIFWVEFTLRHGTGRVEGLRSAGLDLAWYQYFSMDVLALIFISITLGIMGPVLLINTLYKCFVKRRLGCSSKEKKKRK
ncbi:UDP-glucosyltransferase 2-like [Hetaerina americana]|uniref:UDP-glucosyltransferase 2-like n=1 Tax=Hetaerina americana TaxID=62018 RepID=UPI003A7F2C4F